MLKIYGDVVSGNCLKVKYTADFLALPYEWIPLDIMKGETRTDSFLAINPMGQVPVVVLNDGRALAQSNAIIQFLAEGSPLYPADTYLRAKVNEWLFWEQYSHEPYIAVCRFHMRYSGKPMETREAWRVARSETALDLLDQVLKRTQWLVGNSLTIADISLLAYTRLAAEGGFDLATRPSLRAWIARCEEALSLDPVTA